MKHCFSSMVRHAWCEMKLEMDEGDDDSDDDGEMHSVSVAIFFCGLVVLVYVLFSRTAEFNPLTIFSVFSFIFVFW